MKAFFIFTLSILLGVSVYCQYNVYTAKRSGNWTEANNWNITPGTNGQQKNKVVIPPGIIMEADNEVNSMLQGNVDLVVSGTIKLSNHTKLLLSANSSIALELGGKISGKNATQQILIGEVVKYVGSKDKELAGISFASSSTGASPNGFFISSILPVTFESFSAVLFDNGIVQLKWFTSNELNNKLFNIEKSTNGSTWNKVGTVLSKESASRSNAYSYSDVANASKVYYRIAQVDIDGTRSYSAVRSVSAKSTGNAIKVYSTGPNTIIAELNEVESPNIYIAVYSMNGHVVAKKKMNITNGKITMYVDKIQRGTYIVRTDDSAGNISATKVFL